MVETYNQRELGRVRFFVTLPLKLGKLETLGSSWYPTISAIITTPKSLSTLLFPPQKVTRKIVQIK